jgi:predicted alpha/beta superfamily hydrolase
MTPQKKTFFNVWSPQLGNSRTVDIYLPPSYGGARRYPVVYMQDGQNLSDPATAFAGTWRLDTALAALARAGVEAIVVGVHNTEARLAEYSPFPDAKHGGGQGDRYLSFLADTLKPRIDRLFRTRPARRDTVIAGSSMGGLISLYAWLERRDVFGHAAALSPSLWFGRDALAAYVDASSMPPGRLYLDVGTAEGAAAVTDVRAMRMRLRSKGLAADRLRYKEDRGGRHQEEAWSRRIGPALRYLVAKS